MKKFTIFMLTMENICAMGGIIYLISTDNGWWSLLLLAFINVIKTKKKKGATP